MGFGGGPEVLWQGHHRSPLATGSWEGTKQENHKELHWEEFHNDPANGNFDTNA